MFKKKLGILLLLSLAVLFIGLFSTTYARTLSSTEIMNFVLNGYQYKLNSVPSQTIIDNVKAQEQGFEVWAEYTETYEGQYALAFNGYGVSFYYYNGSQANLNRYSPYYYSDSVYVNTSFLSRKRADYNVNENQFYDFSNNNLGLGSSNRFFYTDFNIKTNVNNATPSGANLYTAGTSFPDGNVFAENFVSSDKFEFSPTTSNFQVCSINGLAQPSEVYVYDRNNQDYLTLGYLEKFSNLDNVTITRYRYTKSNGWVETSVNAFDDFNGYNVQDDILTYTIDVSKISADTLVIFNFTPNNIQDFTNQTFALYVKSPYTYISNGVIYPSQTFSGDYFNNYNDDSNTDKIVDNNNENDDFWKKAYNDLFTMSSGDVNGLIDDFRNNTNFNDSGMYSLSESILNTLEGDPQDFIISWNRITTNGLAGTNMEIIPSGDINFSAYVRNIPALGRVHRFVQYYLSLCLVIMFIKNLWFTLMRVLGVGVAMYEDAEDENATVISVTEDINGVSGVSEQTTITERTRGNTTRYHFRNSGR